MRYQRIVANYNIQHGGYILELALLLPVLVGFSLGLVEAINIARANSTLSEAANFGTRELAMLAGRGVSLKDPEQIQKYDWYHYRKTGNSVVRKRIALNRSSMPAVCTIKDSTNIGCTRELHGQPSADNHNTLTYDNNKVISEFVNNEILVGRLPESKLNCKNMDKRGCISTRARYLPATEDLPQRYSIELSYNAPTPFMGALIGKQYITLTATSTRTLESELREVNPLVFNSNVGAQ